MGKKPLQQVDSKLKAEPARRVINHRSIFMAEVSTCRQLAQNAFVSVNPGSKVNGMARP